MINAMMDRLGSIWGSAPKWETLQKFCRNSLPLMAVHGWTPSVPEAGMINDPQKSWQGNWLGD
jgi:hypothetical protein